MQTNYPNIRQQLSPELAEASDAQIEAVLAQRNIDAETMEGFFDDLGKIASSVGKTIVKAAPAVLPVAGTVLGTAFGGPVGAALGQKLGTLAGGAIGAATGSPTPGGISGILGSVLSSGSGSPAAGQLLQTLMTPQTMQALTSMAMGSFGKPNVGVSGTPVPVGAFANLLGVLAGRAEAEYNAQSSFPKTGTQRYLQDYAAEAKGDPAVAESRADALAELLAFDASERASYERNGSYESYEASEASEQESIEAEYDAVESWEMEFEMEMEAV